MLKTKGGTGWGHLLPTLKDQAAASIKAQSKDDNDNNAGRPGRGAEGGVRNCREKVFLLPGRSGKSTQPQRAAAQG